MEQHKRRLQIAEMKYFRRSLRVRRLDQKCRNQIKNNIGNREKGEMVYKLTETGKSE